MKNILDASLADIAPQNLALDRAVSPVIAAIDPQLQAVSQASTLPALLSRIDTLDEPTTDLLAWAFHCDFYDLAATLDMKHEAVKSSLKWHMKKGTPWAILEALKAIGITGTFIPWWQSGDEPYTFRLKAEITGDYYRTTGRDKITRLIVRAVNESKAARSLMAGLETAIHFTENMALHAGLAQALSGHSTIHLNPPQNFKPHTFYVALPNSLQGCYTLPIEKPKAPSIDIKPSIIQMHSWTVDIGVDLQQMQELLLLFEKRIFDRIDQHEAHILNVFNTTQSELNLQLEDIKNLLRWAGEDETV